MAAGLVLQQEQQQEEEGLLAIKNKDRRRHCLMKQHPPLPLCRPLHSGAKRPLPGAGEARAGYRRLLRLRHPRTRGALALCICGRFLLLLLFFFSFKIIDAAQTSFPVYLILNIKTTV